MIQRPQTLYLLFASLINVGVFFTPVYSRAMEDPVPWIGFGLAIALTLAMIVSIAAIFLYTNRTLQLKVVKGGTYLQIIAFGSAVGVLFSMSGLGIDLWPEAIGMTLIIISLAMFWLAGRNIKADEELVQSMDRIR